MDYVLKASQAVTTQADDVSRFHEYQFDFLHASLGVSEINGRYPATGYDVDGKVEQIWYVEKGSGTIWVGGGEHTVEHGDMIHIPPGEKFWIDGAELRLVVASGPPWFPEQHQHVT